MKLNHWVIVGSKSKTRIYNVYKGRKTWDLVKSIPNNEEVKEDIDFLNNPPETGVKTRPVSGKQFTRDNPHNDYSLQLYAKEVKEFIKKSKNKFSKLVLVAEPCFMGILKKNLDKSLLGLVCFQLCKDLDHYNSVETTRFLRQDILQRLPPG